MNYHLRLEEIISEIVKENIRPSLLMHACCGPCSSYCLEYLSSYFDITILYYNPNIYPDNEYYRRLNELKEFLNKIPNGDGINLIECAYNTSEYYSAVKGLENLTLL